MPTLYIIATPIGNLEDISPRALKVLKGVDLILCEDTRVTQKLLNFYNIKTSTLSYHQHSKLKKVDYILDLLKQGKNLALVSDAGTPGISDPGRKLVETVIRNSLSQPVSSDVKRQTLNETGGETDKRLTMPLKIVPVPGPSALTCAASISGFPMDRFLFLGFPPHKKKRRKFFEEVISSKYPVIFYESPYRILKSLRDLHGFMQIGKRINADTRIVVCRELTKKFETVYRGTIEEVIEQLEKEKVRGEFVVIVNTQIYTDKNTDLHR